MSRNFYILAATLVFFALVSAGMSLVPSGFQPGLPANGSLWRTVALILMLAGLASALAGVMSHLLNSSTSWKPGTAECARPGTGALWDQAAGRSPASMESAMSHCPSSERVVRCAVRSGVARTARDKVKMAPRSLRRTAMCDSIEFVHRIEHRHDILHRSRGLNVVNRVENESTVGCEDLDRKSTRLN